MHALSRRKVTAFLAAASLVPAFLISPGVAQTPANPRVVRLGDSGLVATLPRGWRPTGPKPGYEKALGAFQSEDSTSSVFVTVARALDQADMSQVMDGVIANFETAFVLRKVGEVKQGKLADSAAVFTTLDADLRSKTGSDTMPFRFYLAVIDTGDGLYLFQGSIQAPIKKEREEEILALLRSLAKATP